MSVKVRYRAIEQLKREIGCKVGNSLHLDNWGATTELGHVGGSELLIAM